MGLILKWRLRPQPNTVPPAPPRETTVAPVVTPVAAPAAGVVVTTEGVVVVTAGVVVAATTGVVTIGVLTTGCSGSRPFESTGCIKPADCAVVAVPVPAVLGVPVLTDAEVDPPVLVLVVPPLLVPAPT